MFVKLFIITLIFLFFRGIRRNALKAAQRSAKTRHELTEEQRNSTPEFMEPAILTRENGFGMFINGI